MLQVSSSYVLFEDFFSKFAMASQGAWQEEHYGFQETSTKLLLSLCAGQETALGEQNKDKYIVITQLRTRTYKTNK